MSRYINWSDVTARYNFVGRDVDSTKMAETYISYAESYVEGRLSVKYTTPFESTNSVVKDLCIDLVYVKAGNLNVKESGTLMSRVDKVIDMLLDGDMQLIDSTGAAIQQSAVSNVWSESGNYTPTFGLGEIEDFEVDPDLLDHEEDSRD